MSARPPSPPERRSRRAALAGLAAALLASGAAGALGLSCGGTSGPAPDAGATDAGLGAGCNVFLGGLVTYGDAGLLLDDAGFACVALLLRNDAGTRTSLSLTPLGALPAGVESFNAVVVFDGGAPPQFDAGPDAGADAGAPDAGLNLTSPLILQAAASVLVTDTGATTAFAVQKPAAAGVGPGGALSIVFSEVPDAGLAAGSGTVLGAHGTLDASLPYLYGPRPDGGAIDAGQVVKVRATF